MNNQYNSTNKEIEAGLRAVCTTVRDPGSHIPLHAQKLIQVFQNYLASNIDISTLKEIRPEALEIENEPGMRVLELYVRGAHMGLRRHLAVNAPALPQIKAAAKKDSRRGIVAMVAPVLDLPGNKELALALKEVRAKYNIIDETTIVRLARAA